ncbi:two-component system phosphate regulon sensor histidine kinase PhoR [Yoonia maricola]|uniref:histidine kinase n=1 Tax=Yoonia maricola TaxID=420999 RepID=A0A2M8WLU8_9RHOB|nr:ATP-binding protein [Yoonia maricola]PJI91899.1 two-component system phosphate regulon sensor histidine kinase PhoR [Yoonia maricola]
MTAERIASVIAALPLPVLLIGPDERVRAANRLVDPILGTDLIEKHYITAVRQPAVIAAIAETRRSLKPGIARYTGRDGSRDTIYRVSLAAADGDVLLTFEDQTATEEAGQMRRDFVANVSHELRTPLTALLGFIETLSGAARDDPAARDRFLGIMAHEANRMTRLVDDLMSLSRVEEDERVRPREHVDLGALLSSVIKGLEPQANAAGVNVTLDLVASDEMVPGDAGQLVQVFTNLVENAIKYGAFGREVTVQLLPREMNQRLRGDAVQVSVTDRGDGIAEHHIARLTERFYRVDNHRSREVGGTGLGLAIVKHIINRHRGRLLIESEEGQGTKVSVFLPSQPVS